jgi:hypothetical protein
VLADLDGLLRLPVEKSEKRRLPHAPVVVEQGGAVDEPCGLDGSQRRQRQDRRGCVRDGDGRSGGRGMSAATSRSVCLVRIRPVGVGTSRQVPDEIPTAAAFA